MELSHTFIVPAPVEETWAHFNDIESVATCFPGATVTSVEGDDFKGTCKVKLGPIALQYSGSGTFLEKDEAGRRFVIEAKGKDKRGNGTAGAKVTATMAAVDDGTEVNVLTDLAITGKPAQFGRGVMQDVSDKLLQQFTDCLESRLGGGPAPSAEAPSAEAPSSGAPAEAAAETPREAAGIAATAAGGEDAGHVQPEDIAARQVSAPTAAGTTGGGPSYAPPREPQPQEALDLGRTVLPVLAKAYWKQLAGALIVLVVLRAVLRRVRRS